MRGFALTLLSAALSIALSGCVSSTQQSTNLERYSLTQNVAPQVFVSQQDVNVELASTLALGGVTIELSDIAIRPAQNFRYADDLDKELRLLTIDRYLERNFPKNYHTAIFISKFQGTLDGNTKVWAYIEVRNSRNRLLLREEFKTESKAKADGYAPIVEELKNSYLSIIDQVIDKVLD